MMMMETALIYALGWVAFFGPVLIVTALIEAFTID